MQTHRSILLSLAAIIIVACSCPLVSSTAVIPTATVAATAAPVEAAAVATDTPTAPATVIAVPSVSLAMASPSGEAVNCRSGPGLVWSIVTMLQPGQKAEITGKTADGGWAQVKNPSLAGSLCWVSLGVVTTTGDMGGVAVVAAPPTPLASPTSDVAYVTEVSVSVSPSTIGVAGCMGPIQNLTASATIVVSGPMKLEWHFDTQQRGSLPSHTLSFTKAGAKNVSADFTPKLIAGKYRVELVIDGVNLKGMDAVAFYKISC